MIQLSHVILYSLDSLHSITLATTVLSSSGLSGYFVKQVSHFVVLVIIFSACHTLHSFTWAYTIIQYSCFPHVVNIAVQTVLKELEENPYNPVIRSSTTSSPDLVEYAEALCTKPVSNTRSIVAICRKSGSCCVELQNIIAEGICDGTWPELRVIQLLRDCVMCWSSTYNMVDRCIELYPVSLILSFI